MGKLKNVITFIFYSFLLFIIYAMLIFPAGIYDYFVGLLLSVLILFISLKIMESGKLRFFSLKNIIWIIAYIPYLFMKIVQANFDIALRVLNPKLPIHPGFIKVKCDSKDKLAKLMIANSITLTPGTLTLEIKDDYLIIHTVDETVYKDREHIKANFPYYLKEIE
ncbi:Na+/H+ antiporter subunit E [candidate division WOR-3 bacterium]|nr:Na+/H+ antiporter subunit E [candidate division WOR-3 bacterium]